MRVTFRRRPCGLKSLAPSGFLVLDILAPIFCRVGWGPVQTSPGGRQGHRGGPPRVPLQRALIPCGWTPRSCLLDYFGGRGVNAAGSPAVKDFIFKVNLVAVAGARRW